MKYWHGLWLQRDRVLHIVVAARTRRHAHALLANSFRIVPRELPDRAPSLPFTLKLEREEFATFSTFEAAERIPAGLWWAETPDAPKPQTVDLKRAEIGTVSRAEETDALLRRASFWVQHAQQELQVARRCVPDPMSRAAHFVPAAQATLEILKGHVREARRALGTVTED